MTDPTLLSVADRPLRSAARNLLRRSDILWIAAFVIRGRVFAAPVLSYGIHIRDLKGAQGAVRPGLPRPPASLSGLLYQASSSLSPPILFHAMNNGVLVPAVYSPLAAWTPREPG